MSNVTIQILDSVSTLEIETSFGSIVNNIEIEKYDQHDLNIINNSDTILVSDLPDNIPMSKIIGNLDVTRIDNLDTYLDSYAFDCGSP